MAHIHSYLSTYLFPRQILQAGMHSKYLHMYVGVFMDMHRLKLQSYHGYKQRLVLNFTTFYKDITQYGHSQPEKKLGLGDKYHRSIKVHT